MIAKWLAVLGRLRAETGHPAYIAGGAVRDTILGRPVRDVDIWVLNGDPERVDRWIESAGGHCDFDLSYAPDLGAEDRGYGIGPVYTLVEDGVTYNVIITSRADELAAIVAGFDFALCQAWLNEAGAPDVTRKFAEDAHYRRFTLIRGHAKERSMKRFERLQEKYQGWTLVVPEEFR